MAMAATTDYRFGIFRLDLAGRRLLRGNEEVHLTSGEFDLLSVFTKRPNRVLSRDQLIELLKGYDRDAFDRSIDIRIARLRHKIENDPSSPIHIRTVEAKGISLTPQTRSHFGQMPCAAEHPASCSCHFSGRNDRRRSDVHLPTNTNRQAYSRRSCRPDGPVSPDMG